MVNFAFIRALFGILLVVSIAHGISKKQQKLERKVSQLVTWSEADEGIIRMDAPRFKQYVRLQPKDYSMFVMLTALKPERNCGQCKAAYEQYQILAYSWLNSKNYVDLKKKVFLAIVDYDDGPDVFHYLKLNNAPVFIHFPPQDSMKSRQDTFDAHVKGFSADSLARWISERASIDKFKIVKPPDYTMLGTWLGVIVLSFIVIITQRERLTFLYNRDLWAILITAVAVFFMSGQMWNTIRGPPFSHRDHRSGDHHYLLRQMGSQLVAETYIVGLVYATITVGMVLIHQAKAAKTLRKGIKRLMAFIGLTIYVLFCGLMLGIYSAKNNGYPYNYFSYIYNV